MYKIHRKPGASLWTGLSQKLAQWLFVLSKSAFFQVSVEICVLCHEKARVLKGVIYHPKRDMDLKNKMIPINASAK